MEEKLLGLDGDMSIKKIIDKINYIISMNFSILSKQDDIEKWNGLPKLLTLNNDIQQALVRYVIYIDNLLISVEDKAMYIISLSSLIEFGNIDINIYDDGSLFTMADYYKDSSISDIKNTIPLLKNPTLLLAVREKTLDLKDRKKILLNITNKFINDKIDSNNINQYNEFINNIIKMLETEDYYELLK